MGGLLRSLKKKMCSLQVEDLKWEVEQKERDFRALKQQLSMTEQRSQKELEGLQEALQVGAVATDTHISLAFQFNATC